MPLLPEQGGRGGLQGCRNALQALHKPGQDVFPETVRKLCVPSAEFENRDQTCAGSRSCPLHRLGRSLGGYHASITLAYD